MLSDEEVIATWMAPKPTVMPGMLEIESEWWHWRWSYVGPSLPQQQRPVKYDWHPRALTLDRIHLVEARLLSDNTLRERYFWQMAEILFGGQTWPGGVTEYLALLHASAKDKIHALAQVLRAEGADHA